MKTFLLFACLLASAFGQNAVPVITNAADKITLGVEAKGSLPMTYQWYRNDAPIAGATAPILVITNTTATGSYYCVAKNAAGQAKSDAVKLANTSANDAPAVTITRKKP